jgi:hypothetical protein
MEDSAQEAPQSAPLALVLVGCSRRKLMTPGLLPAIERYDGPIFRLLRRFLRAPARPVSIQILSATQGLIPAACPIPWYDCLMTTARAEGLRANVEETLCAVIGSHTFTGAFVCLGGTYWRAMPDLAALMPAAVPVHIATGSMGRRLGLLHDWLYGEPPVMQQRRVRSETARIRGIECNLSVQETLSVARNALRAGHGNPHAFQSWYVWVDGQRVAPKWLVHELTGLPVSAFTTDEARRVLAQIGVPVCRV